MLEYLGNVNIPLRRTPYDIPTYQGGPQYIFDEAAYNPAMKFAALTDGVPGNEQFTRIVSVVPRINGTSEVLLGEAITVGAADTAHNYAGTEQGLYYDGGPGSTWMKVVPQPLSPGIYPALQTTEQLLGFGRLIPQPYPGAGNGTRAVPTIWFAAADAVSTYSAYVFNALAQKVNSFRVGVVAGPFIIAGWNHSQFLAGCFPSMMTVNGRNYGFIGANGNHPALRWSWINQDFSLITDSPFVFNNIPDATVTFGQTAIQNAFAAGLFTQGVFSQGFQFVIQTNGAGPNGYPYELVVCNPEMTQFRTIRWVPLDTQSIVALGRAAAISWTFKIDTDGTIYWHSGHASDATKMFYSFVPLGFQYPQILPVNYPPVDLPCFQPCWPIAQEQ